MRVVLRVPLLAAYTATRWPSRLAKTWLIRLFAAPRTLNSTVTGSGLETPSLYYANYILMIIVVVKGLAAFARRSTEARQGWKSLRLS
jgi:hypothetical protein